MAGCVPWRPRGSREEWNDLSGIALFFTVMARALLNHLRTTRAIIGSTPNCTQVEKELTPDGGFEGQQEGQSSWLSAWILWSWLSLIQQL